MKWSFRIGSIMGIPVKVHLTFRSLLALIFFVGNSIIESADSKDSSSLF